METKEERDLKYYLKEYEKAVEDAKRLPSVSEEDRALRLREAIKKRALELGIEVD